MQCFYHMLQFLLYEFFFHFVLRCIFFSIKKKVIILKYTNLEYVLLICFSYLKKKRKECENTQTNNFLNGANFRKKICNYSYYIQFIINRYFHALKKLLEINHPKLHRKNILSSCYKKHSPSK